jgi:two-component system, response regulator PdtaR
MEKQVMIVEDCFVQSTIIKKMLETEQFRITSICRSGQEAICAVHKEIPAVILMDICINGDLNGIETAIEIRKKFKVPVLFLTAMNNHEVTDEINNIQFSGLLYKPVSKFDLFSHMEKVMNL